MPETTLPTVEDVAAFLALENVGYPPDQLQDVYDAEIDEQYARCVTDPYTSALAEAFKRRCGRTLAARGAALGVNDLGEFGSQPLLRWDPIIESLEADYRKGPFG